jgi:glutamyl-tRNA synthetase
LVRTRFAPSPTGYLHIGGARTALFSWLFARKHGGQFVLRIEDTDLERSTPESVDAILQGMAWLNLDYDEGPFFQTQRFDRYNEIIQQWLAEGKAYYCYASQAELDALREEQMVRKDKPRYDGRYRDFTGIPPAGIKPVVRFKNPLDGEVVINDMVKGRVVVQNSELDDLIIQRSDGSPTYNFTVVVDDWEMNITHVIRGDDHLNNTPRQINMLKALGVEPPVYAHLPMVLGEDGQRLSKRHGAVSVLQYKEAGYLPDGLLNYLARLGWSHGDQEIFSRDELIQYFDLGHINGAPGKFDADKCLWTNQQHIQMHGGLSLAPHVAPHLAIAGIDLEEGPDLPTVCDLLKERAKTLGELALQAHYFYADPTSFDEAMVEKHWKTPTAKAVLMSLRELLVVADNWSVEWIHHSMVEAGKLNGVKMGQVGMPFRLALTGSGQSPAIDSVAHVLGKITVVRRLSTSIEQLS